MKSFFLFLVTLSSLFGAAKIVAVDARYQSSQSCKPCHLRIVKEWEGSWHAKSHYNSDEYFRKSLDYVARKTRKSLNSVKVKCATCHNPRISVTSTDEDYEIEAIMGLDAGSEVDKAVNADTISEGINCIVCHNIDKIHDEYDASKRGINRVEWTKSVTMTGPFKDAISPYHKTIHHEFMDKNPNKLCFVCHANDRSVNGLVFTNMQDEYVKGSKKCVECHMGKQHKDVAATYRMYAGKAKIRNVRHHGFKGAHTSTMWKNALHLELSQKGKDIFVTLENPQPHNIPSGYGSRELELSLVYKRGTIIVAEKKISLTNTYTRKKGKKATAHLALATSKDNSIRAHGKKVLKIEKVKGATSVEVVLSYILVNQEVRSLLKLEGKNWSDRHFITKKVLKIK